MRLSAELIELIKAGLVKSSDEFTIEDDEIKLINDLPLNTIYDFFSRQSASEPTGAADDAMSANDDLLNSDQVCAMLDISLSTLHRLRRTEGFPAAIAISERKRRWPRAEIVSWMARNK